MRIHLHEHIVTLAEDVEFEAVKVDPYAFDDGGYNIVLHAPDEGRWVSLNLTDDVAHTWWSNWKAWEGTPDEERHSSEFDTGSFLAVVQKRCEATGADGERVCRRPATHWEAMPNFGGTRYYCDDHHLPVVSGPV